MVKVIFLAYIAWKRKLEKCPFFDQNHWLTPFEKNPDAIGADAWSTDQLRGHYACFNRLICVSRLCQQKTYGHIICGALICWGRNCSEILPQIITINIYIFFMTLKVISLRILHIYYIQISALCETCTNNHLGTLRQQVKKFNWNGLHIPAFWELLRQTVF